MVGPPPRGWQRVPKWHPQHGKKLQRLPIYKQINGFFRRLGRRTVRSWWAWELIAAGISVAATIGLLVLLALADQHKQQTWAVGQTELTLNTLVAAISTIIRSSLLLAVAGPLNQSAWNWFASGNAASEPPTAHPLKDFEVFSEAAANSWNSAKLMWQTKCRYLASLGALIVILCLAFDTFVQQVLAIDMQPQPSPLSTNLMAENMLPHVKSFENAFAIMVGSNARNLPLDAEAAFENGLLNKQNAFPGAICPTANCTWPVTPTLGICGQCSDITNKIGFNTTNGTVSYYLQRPDSGETLPPDMSPAQIFDLTHDQIILQQAYNGTGLGPDGFVLDVGSWQAPPENATRCEIAVFHAFGVSTSANLTQWCADRSSGWPSRLKELMVGYECSLHFCLRGYTASTTLGKMDQQPASVTVDRMRPEPAPMQDNSSWIFEQIPSALNVSDPAAYTVDESSRQEFGWAMSDVLSGRGSVAYVMADTPSGGATILDPDTSIVSTLWTSSDSLANITSRVESVAVSLTSWLRTTQAWDPDARYAPTATTLMPVVRVRWAWLAYPITLLIAGLLFLVLTMAATSRRRVRPWKGHRVPLLLADIDETLYGMAKGGMLRRTGLDDRIGQAPVRLEFDGVDRVVFRYATDRSTSPPKPLSPGADTSMIGTYL